MNLLITLIFLLSAPSLLYSMSDTIEAKVWCPEGTWWSYKIKSTPWLKDKDHEIFIYEKDTFILNKVAKKINVFYMQTEWSIQPDGSLLDSAIYGPLYMSSIFLCNSNCSYNKSNCLSKLLSSCSPSSIAA